MQRKVFTTEELLKRAKCWLRQIGKMKSHSFACCLPMSVVRADGPGLSLTFCFRTSKVMENPWGVTHGGMLALALDWAMGASARTILDQCDAPTVSMQIDYLKPVPLDADLYIRVEVDHAGKNLAHLCATGYLAEGEMPCVKASGHYFMRNLPLVLMDDDGE